MINIFICSIEEKTSVINDNLCKQIPKLIFDKRYDSAKESIVITLNDCKDHPLKVEELEKCKSRFASMFKNYHILNWDINCPPYSSPNEGEQKKILKNIFIELIYIIKMMKIIKIIKKNNMECI